MERFENLLLTHVVQKSASSSVALFSIGDKTSGEGRGKGKKNNRLVGQPFRAVVEMGASVFLCFFFPGGGIFTHPVTHSGDRGDGEQEFAG